MDSLVRELQRDALDINVSVPSILRKALVVARKLGISDFKEWCERELNGYKNKSEIPNYRFVNGELKAHNPYRGLIPVIMPAEMAETFSQKAIGQPIAELEDVSHKKNNGGFLTIPISKSLEATFVQMLDGMYPFFVISSSEIMGILDSVRNFILDWSLKLEEQGILGEDMAFSEDEKRAAPTVTYNIGQMINSQIQHDTIDSLQSMDQGIDLAEITKFIETLKNSIQELTLQSDQRSELESEIQTIEAQTKSPKPKLKIIRESLTSIRTILESAAGSILAAKLLEHLPNLL